MKKLLLLFTLLFSLQTQATHLMGGQMTSKNIGGLTYEVTLTLYRDVQGIPMSTTETINYQDSLGTSIIASHTIPINNIVNIGNGVERYQFIDTMTFSSNGKYKAYYTNCCRNASIINIPNASSYSMYLDVDIFADPTNSSPVFLNEPITLAQDSVLFTYNPLPFDADGDSLSWVLDMPMSFSSTFVTGAVIAGYVLPYSYPSTPFQLDPLTGEITFLPNTIGNFQVSVKAIEWRNGIEIGYIRRDMQLIVIPSPNIPIQVSTTTSVLRAISTNTPININVGETLTFTLDAYNPDGGLISFQEGGSAFLASTPASVVAVQNTTSNYTATITWTPTLAEVNNSIYYMSFRIGDPWGPYTFFNDYTYSILVTNNLTNIDEIKSSKDKYVIKSINMLGQEIDPNSDGFRIDVYSDGSTQKIYKLN